MSDPTQQELDEQERELLLLALLEEYHSDRATGLHRDLADYYAATPELEMPFLEQVMTTGPKTLVRAMPDNIDNDDTPTAELAPGVRRALASLPGFNADNTESTQKRLVAEERAPYNTENKQADRVPPNTDDPGKA